MQVDELQRELKKVLDEKKGRQMEGVYSESRLEGMRNELSHLKSEVARLTKKRETVVMDIEVIRRDSLAAIDRDEADAKKNASETRRIKNEIEAEQNRLRSSQDRVDVSNERAGNEREVLRAKTDKLKAVLKEIE